MYIGQCPPKGPKTSIDYAGIVLINYQFRSLVMKSIAHKFHDSLSEFHYSTSEAEVSGSDLKNIV